MEKKNGGLITLVVVLALLVGLLGGYFLMNYFLKGNDTPNGSSTSDNSDISVNSEKISLDDSRFIDIFNKLEPFIYKTSRSDSYKSFTESELLNIVSSELKESDFVKTTEKTVSGVPYYTLDNSIVINYLKKYFGNNVAIDGTKLINPSLAYATKLNFDGMGSGMAVFDYLDGKYKVGFSGIGGAVGPQPKITVSKIISAVIENNEIIVKEKAIYYDIAEAPLGEEPITYNIYSDVNKKNKIDLKEYTYYNITDGAFTVEDYIDKASTITTRFSYDKESNSYYFKSSIIQ